MTLYNSILVATDGSEGSGPAVAFALWLAGVTRAEVTAIQVIDENGYEDLLGVAAPETESIRYEHSIKAAESVVSEGKAMGVKTKPLIVSGNPAGEIARASQDYDLTVMGTAGRSGASRLLLGSVAEKVVRSAQSPVLVVPSDMNFKADGPKMRHP
jgi:nucleotide-binding universal stress UspA family protein